MEQSQIGRWTSADAPIVFDATGSESARALLVGSAGYDAAWTPIVGPSAMAVARHVGFRLLSAAPSVAVTIPDLAAAIGVKPSIARHALGRLLMFGLAIPAPGELAVSLYIRADAPSNRTSARAARRFAGDTAA